MFYMDCNPASIFPTFWYTSKLNAITPIHAVFHEHEYVMLS